MVDFSKVIQAMKALSPWRFFALWVWLMLLAAAPVLFGIAKLLTAIQ